MVENFDATKQYTLTYTYLGSQRITTNEISIRPAVSGSQPVYTRQSTKYDKNHIIPENTLSNGATYWAKIRVKTSNETWSDWSPEVEFLCLATPVLQFDSLDDKNYIYNNDVMMSIIYRQEQGERAETYQFSLLDENKTPIKVYPARVPDFSSPNYFSERFSDLVKGKLYYVGIRITTKNGINYFETHEFMPHFVAPTLNGGMIVRNNGDSGQVIVQSYLKQILGTQTKPFIPNAENDNSNNYTYMKDQWIIIPNEMPLMYTRLGMAKASDFIVKLWGKNILNGLFLDFSKELGEGIHLKFYKHDDFITCEKEYNGIKSITKSNVVRGLGMKEFYLYINVVEFRIEIKITPVI